MGKEDWEGEENEAANEGVVAEGGMCWYSLIEERTA